MDYLENFMIKELIKIANRLDTMGLKVEADSVDRIIRKIAMNEMSSEEYLKSLEWNEGTNLKKLNSLIEEYLDSYSRSKDWDNPDSKDDSIMADEARSKIAMFLRGNLSGMTEEEIDDKVNGTFNTVGILEILTDKLHSELESGY